MKTSAAIDARRKRHTRELVEHTTETRVDLAEGDRERIAQLEKEVEDLKECLFHTLEAVKDICPKMLEVMAAAMQIDARQGRLEASSNALAESIKIMGRGVA